MKKTCVVEFTETRKRRVAIEIEVDKDIPEHRLYAEMLIAAEDIRIPYVRLDDSDQVDDNIEILEQIDSLEDFQDDEAGKCFEFDGIRFRELYD